MKRKNAIIFSLIVISVTGIFCFLGIRAALYGLDDVPVAGHVYNWLIHTQNSQKAGSGIPKKQISSNTQTATTLPKSKNTTSSKSAKTKNTSSKSTKTKSSTTKSNVDHKPDYIMEATAYVDIGQTKTQIYAGVGSVAVDPKVVPHGTLLYIEGYGLALATDTGRLIKGHSVDVWFSDKKTAMEWGRKKVKVWKVGQADIKKILATGGKYVKY